MASNLPTMNWSDPDLGEAISVFKQNMSLYLEDEEITDAAKQARTICHGFGDEGLKRLVASGLSEGDREVPANIWIFFEGQLKLNVNFRLHRHHLMQHRQKPGESIDDFVSRARTTAQKCQFTDDELNERLIELIIASTPHDALRKYLYSKPKGFSLDDALAEGRKYESLSAGGEQRHQLGPSPTEKIHIVNRGRTCQYCATKHMPRQCPAYSDECFVCGVKGHWTKCCKKEKGQRPQHFSQSQRSRSRSPQTKHQGYQTPNSDRTLLTESRIGVIDSKGTDSPRLARRDKRSSKRPACLLVL